ncbi:protein kinase [Stieleria sp. TO1_6]|uniref:protein kinase domain-containing protein n=1 Tax=Stieleria tagensis TaxID=2956795 RepID=UPI00209A738F|nr:protein kinase [Stieleria tagensis]MCO8123936.1 protein kinase [Stieleria tagensis]
MLESQPNAAENTMMTATECPSHERLRAFSQGRLPDEEGQELFQHLSECQACMADLETVDDADDSLIADLRAGDEHADLVNEPQYRRAMANALAALAGSSAHDADGSVTRSGIDTFPQQIGEYEIVRPIGRGGMGKVYLARHTKLGRPVAVKLLANHRLADQRMRDRFDAEMQAIGRLSHPNIVTAHDAREVEGTAVLVTEYIDGLDLGNLVARVGPLSIANACEIGCKVAAALQYTSDQGFVHRDVKPSNIMLSRNGEVKLLDLGLAKYHTTPESSFAAAELTGTGQAIGTADFVSPEQVTDGRSVDCRSDIYSLGCTLFHLLTGQAPFADADHQTAFSKMTAHVSDQPPSLAGSLADCPAGLVRLVDSMLAKNPDRRPPHPSDVAASLANWTAGHDLVKLVETATVAEVQTRPLLISTSTRPKAWHQRTVPITVAIGLGLLGTLVGLMLGMFLTITYPDGTVVKVPIDGAKLEVTQDTSSQPADELEQVDQPKTVDESPARSAAARQQRAAEHSAATMERLQGVWQIPLDAQGQVSDRGSIPASADGPAMLFVVDKMKFYCAVVRNGEDPKLSYGEFVGLMVKNDSLSLTLNDESSEQRRTLYLEFPEKDQAEFRFDPFAKTPPFHAGLSQDPNVRVPSHFLLKRLGKIPTDIAEMREVLGDQMSDPNSPLMQAWLMIFQAKTMGPKYYLEQMETVKNSAAATRSRNNLKQLAIAFHNFNDTYKTFPGSVNKSAGYIGVNKQEDVQPFSWRVAILPFIDQNELFEQYKFDQPWDSQSNLQLLEKMPGIYRSPFADADQPVGNTNYMGYATEQGALGTNGGVKLKEFADGTANTILLVGCKESVPWTKPEDMHEQSELLKPLTVDPLIYAMVDGSVRTADKFDPHQWRAMITRDGRESMDVYQR